MVDVQAQLDAVTRTLQTKEVEGAPSYVQTIAQEYPAPIEDVWDAVTTADRVARWFLPVSGELRVGGRFELQGNASGEVLECNAPRDGGADYRVTWEFGGGVTWLTVRLAAVDGGRTRLELEHAAHTDEVPEDMWATFGPGATGVGWDGAMLGLAMHLGAVDGAITPEQVQEWQLSDEGKAFTRAAADGWAAAHVAFGADPDAAARAADATYGFYTGA